VSEFAQRPLLSERLAPIHASNPTDNMTAEQLQQLIAARLPCDHLEVSGDGRHWSAVIVSPAFEGLRLIARHKRVYDALGQRIENDEVHALSMKTLTPTEWQKK
jgi:acid stress-induced BolA-like protein IbaG/YrbA